MKKTLLLNDQATHFIIKEFTPPKKSTIDTPWGEINEVYVNKVLKPTSQSEYGTEAYRASLSRAFNRAKQQIYFNPDMTQFVTLTYKENMQDEEKLLSDVKYMIKLQKRMENGQKPKYIFVIEKQKRGALHVHMICNNFLSTYKNKNKYKSVKYWYHGYSSVLDVKNADENFKPYLYLFKYMKKSQRIGSSFVHTSRNLNNFMELDDFEFDKRLHELQFTETSQLGMLDLTIKKSYYKRR